MKKGKYTHVQALLAEGNTRREAAEYYNFRDKQVIKGLLKRERRKGEAPLVRPPLHLSLNISYHGLFFVLSAQSGAVHSSVRTGGLHIFLKDRSRFKDRLPG